MKKIVEKTTDFPLKSFSLPDDLQTDKADREEERHAENKGDLVYGDKVEINNNGEHCVNNYADMVSSDCEIRNLRKLLREKEEVIKSLREMIEILKSDRK